MAGSMTESFVNLLVAFATDWLIPVMGLVFLAGFMFRALVYLTVKSENRFTLEFDKRVQRYINRSDDSERMSSFHELVKHLLHQTYNDVFEKRKKYKRRKVDHVASTSDRVFLVQDGVSRIIKDTLKQTKYLKRERNPKMQELAKQTFGANPVFNKVLGIFPIGMTNDFLGILPGLFIIGGIFGTFLGIMKALQLLGGMDAANIEATRQTMDLFLVKISYSMSTSIVGIILSVLTNILNTAMSADGIYLNVIQKYTASLEHIWNETDDNEVIEPDPMPEDETDSEGVRKDSGGRESEISHSETEAA